MQEKDIRLCLQELGNLPQNPLVKLPAYDPREIKPGIVHLGWGNFAASHLGSYINDMLSTDPNLGIVAASIRNGGTIHALRKQDNLYTVLEREHHKQSAVVMAPVVDTIYAKENPWRLVQTLADPQIKLVTVTVTNAGYYLTQSRRLDVQNGDIGYDLHFPESPRTIYWYLAQALYERMVTHGTPLVIMSLDNVEANSKGLEIGLCDFTSAEDPTRASCLLAWMRNNIDFPVTTIDRITPTVDDAIRQKARKFLGFDTNVLIATEVFKQFVVEKTRFPMPNWESVGVQVVDDCSPYWQRKFFCLNAGHQIVSIPAQRLGAKHIHEAMKHRGVAQLLERAHQEFASFLGGGKDLEKYCASIRGRFADATLNDEVQRVAARTTSKVSERILTSVERAYAATDTIPRVPTFVTAVWLLNTSGKDEYNQNITFFDTEYNKLRGTEGNPGSPACMIDALLLSWDGQSEATPAQLEALKAILITISKIARDDRFKRMSEIEPFVQELSWGMMHVHRDGVEKAVEALLARP